MKARGRTFKTFLNYPDYNSCEEHLHPPSVGICPHCLNERLTKLVCSDCGERRVAFCSCSEIEIRRNSCSNVEFGGVGKASFSAETGGFDPKRRSFLLRRSNSNCAAAGVEKSGGFGRIKRLFVKKKNKLELCDENSGENSFGARKSGFGSVFPIKEREGETSAAIDGGGFIELKLESWGERKQEFCAGRRSTACDYGVGYRKENFELPQIIGSLKRNGVSGNGGSCRITMEERGLKEERRNSKVWKWIFKNRSASDHEEEKY